MANAIEQMRAVTIAQLHGYAVGGGFLLAVSCDLRVAAEGTAFFIPEVELGIPLTWGGVPRMVRELGPALTKELVMTCRRFDAREAKEMRFLNRVVPADRLEAEARALAASVLAMPAVPVVDHQGSGQRRRRGDGARRAPRILEGDVLYRSLGRRGEPGGPAALRGEGVGQERASEGAGRALATAGGRGCQRFDQLHRGGSTDDLDRPVDTPGTLRRSLVGVLHVVD